LVGNEQRTTNNAFSSEVAGFDLRGSGYSSIRRRSTMQIREIMTPRVEVIHPDATLQEAAEKMQRLDIGPLPVCDGERLVGMLTDRDITVRATAEGWDPKAKMVREAMTEQVYYCFEDQDVREAAEIMERAQIRRLPVINREKRLVGIVSLGDLAVRTDEGDLADEEVGETLAAVSEPARSGR
jgi:CBS domain-containing protein